MLFFFGVNSSLPPFWTDDGSITYDPPKMKEVFSIVFQNKKSDQDLNYPPTYFPNPKFTYFDFKFSQIKYYLKDLNPHGGLDPHSIFPLFLNKMAVILAVLHTAGKLPEEIKGKMLRGSKPPWGLRSFRQYFISDDLKEK